MRDEPDLVPEGPRWARVDGAPHAEFDPDDEIIATAAAVAKVIPSSDARGAA